MAKLPVTNPPPIDTPSGAATPPVTPPAPPVSEADAIKERPVGASQPVVDRVQVTTGASGEPSSASISTEPVPTVREPAFGVLTERGFGDRGDVSYAGSMPASRRVLPGGREQEVSTRVVDTTERQFTAAIRILRSDILYEPGSPVPLTRREFEVKREARAIAETDWSDGADTVD